ncbi:MAG: flagellar biosynthesis protein FliQ [Betaproteobacteria bacterium]|nr:flagellar biosynthesis protein FliQ [Betaproteobacteria bacterium]
MTPETVLTIVRQSLEVGLLVAAPMLGAALVTGLVVGILQAATQVNEMTLSFIPKLVALFATLAVAGPWMLSTLVDFTRRLLTELPQLVG